MKEIPMEGRREEAERDRLVSVMGTSSLVSGDEAALVKPELHVEHVADLYQGFSIFLIALSPYSI